MAIDLDFMNTFLEENPVPVEKEKSNGHKAQPGRSNTTPRGGHKGSIEEQDAFLERNHIEAEPRRQTDNGGTEREIPCPNGPHQASVYRYEDGTFGFKCFHTSKKCHELHWSDFAEMVEPGYGHKQEQAELEALKTEIAAAMEGKDVSALYDLAEQVAQLPTKEQEILCATIKNTMAKCKDFSWSGFKKLLSEAAPPRNVSHRTTGGETYLKTPNGMLLRTQWGPEELSNFAATITEDIITDDGAERHRGYAICAELNGRRFDFEVKASEFAACNWVDQRLGARATVNVGQSIKGHLINAIKTCSTDLVEAHYYAHTGWRRIDGEMVYLHAGNTEFCQSCQVLSGENYLPDNNVNALEKPIHESKCQSCQSCQVNIKRGVKLDGKLSLYALPAVPEDLITPIRASLGILDLAPYTITAPLYCSVWRAVLSYVDFGVHLAGPSGQGKTELVALIQQHFGSGMNSRNLPGSWESTENALEMQMFQAADAVFVCDDFKPKGNQAMQAALHAKADRVFRQVGNKSARARLTSTLEQRPERPPRCLLISTGEDVPHGQSLKARAVVLMMTESITKGEASLRLRTAQANGAHGLYAQAMAGYIAWLAPRIENLQKNLHSLIADEREALSLGGHARTETNTAQMLLGMKTFLQYAQEVGAVSEQEARAYLARCRTALMQVAEDAGRENTHDKPSEQWKRNLIAAITAKQAYLTTPKGNNPGLVYGWKNTVRQVEHDGVISEEESFTGGGQRIGWIDGDDVYLLPAAAYQAAKNYAARNGDDITTTESMMRKLLLQDNLLASTELKTRQTITVRRNLENTQQKVLHLKKEILFPDMPPPLTTPDKPDIPDKAPRETASQAFSDTTPMLSGKTHLSGDISDKHLTTHGNRPHIPFPETDTIDGHENIDLTISRVGLALKDLGRVQWPNVGYLPLGMYLKRLREGLLSNDPAERAAAQAEVARRLPKNDIALGGRR